MPECPAPSPPLLDFHHISVMRGEKTVLHDITLRIQAGEHVAILGPNGCGKSTLIKTITRECYPLARAESSLTHFRPGFLERFRSTEVAGRRLERPDEHAARATSPASKWCFRDSSAASESRLTTT